MKKQLLSFALAFILILTPFSAQFVSAADSLNSASTWARDGITAALTKGFVPAEIQSNYTNVITRQEFCRMAVKWVEYATGKKIDTILSDKGLTRSQNAFSDTKDPDILAAFALGITSGTSAPTTSTSGTFTPNGQFSREQAATMIMNTCKAIGANTDNPPASGFADLSTASNWAVTGINYVRANGIMQGTSINPPTFSPKTNYTREQSVITFNNIDLEKLVISNNPIVDVGIVGVWVFDSITISGVAVTENEYENLFPAGMPYLRLNEDGSADMFNFVFEYDVDADTFVGVVESGGYSQNNNSVSVTCSDGRIITLLHEGDVLTMQTSDITLHFSNLTTRIK